MTEQETYDFLNNLLEEKKFSTVPKMKAYLKIHHSEEWKSNEIMRKWIAEV